MAPSQMRIKFAYLTTMCIVTSVYCETNTRRGLPECTAYRRVKETDLGVFYSYCQPPYLHPSGCHLVEEGLLSAEHFYPVITGTFYIGPVSHRLLSQIILLSLTIIVPVLTSYDNFLLGATML